jgi:hypothetical protein
MAPYLAVWSVTHGAHAGLDSGAWMAGRGNRKAQGDVRIGLGSLRAIATVVAIMVCSVFFATVGSTTAQAATIVCTGPSSSVCFDKASNVACSGPFTGQIITIDPSSSNFGDPVIGNKVSSQAMILAGCSDAAIAAATGSSGGSGGGASGMGVKNQTNGGLTLRQKIEAAKDRGFIDEYLTVSRQKDLGGTPFDFDVNLTKADFFGLIQSSAPDTRLISDRSAANHLGVYVTPDSGGTGGAGFGAGGYAVRSSGFSVVDSAGLIAPGSTTPGFRATAGNGSLGAVYDASYLVGPAQGLVFNGEFNYQRIDATLGTTPDLVALGVGTGAGSVRADNYGFIGAMFYANRGTYVTVRGGYDFGHATEFQTVDASTGSFNSDGWFADARLGHFFVLVKNSATAPVYAKAPPRPADGYALGLDLSGHIGYVSSKAGAFTDSTGFIFGPDRLQFGDAGLKAKLIATVQNKGVVWMPYVAITGDRQFGYSDTLSIPDQVALAGGDLLRTSQALTTVGTQIGLDVRAPNGWIIGARAFYQHSADLDATGGQLSLKIPLGPPVVAARY